MYIEDTIAAIATPPGVGGVGIIRVSGKEAFSIVEQIFQSKGTVPLAERQNRTVQYGNIVQDGTIVDEVLLLLMKGPHSYTAEDVIEVQCHGGIVAIRKILSLLLEKGVRLAEPGEFTRRAFLNGRIDLIQAEAIIDIIEAKSEDALSLAVQQLEGSLTQSVRAIRNTLIELIAHVEVTIDYPEEDIEDVTAAEVADKLEPILSDMTDMLATAHTGRLIRDGISVAIVGLPNAGKSSLMNALLRENRAIVTDIPGTTRDSIEEYMTVQGISVRLIDTAGIRETKDIVEQIGVKRSLEHIEKADVVFAVVDASTPLLEDEISLLKGIKDKKACILLNKSDAGITIQKEDVQRILPKADVLQISAKENEGLQQIYDYLKELVYGGSVKQDYSRTLSNIRHIHLMESAKEQLVQATNNISMGMPLEFVATDMRGAWELLGEITGDSVHEELSNELFSRFCLGK